MKRGRQYADGVVVGVERWKAENGDSIGGHDINVYPEDDSCSSFDIAAMAAERLVTLSGLIGVVGPQCSGGTLSAVPVYAKAGVVMISGSATRTDLTLTQPKPRFFFRTAYTNAVEGAEQARYIISELNVKTAYVVDDSEPYGNDLADAARQALEAKGVAVSRGHVVEGAVDFSELADQIATASPGVVVFEGYNPEGALLYRQLRDAGYNGPFVGGDGLASASDFIEPLGLEAEGAVIAGCAPTFPRDFLDEYDETMGYAPSTAFPGHYADAATILLDAVASVATEQADGSLVIDPLELREAVGNQRLSVGISGAIAFDENGDRAGEYAALGLGLCKVKDGKFVRIKF